MVLGVPIFRHFRVFSFVKMMGNVEVYLAYTVKKILFLVFLHKNVVKRCYRCCKGLHGHRSTFICIS